MNMLRNGASPIPGTLRGRLADAQPGTQQWLRGATASVRFADLLNGSCVGGRVDELVGRSVVVDTRDQFSAALALVELDGIARRLIICPPDFPAEHRRAVVEQASADALVSDRVDALFDWPVPRCIRCHDTVTASRMPVERFDTEWVLFTSGTSGAPKMVAHTLGTLTAPIANRAEPVDSVLWGTFYDIRRYGGLQVLIRASSGTRRSFCLVPPNR